MASVLIIDDDRSLCKLLSEIIIEAGHRAVAKPDLQSGIMEARAGAYDIVFLDVNLPDGNGIDILPKLRTMASEPEIIIMTGYGDPDGAELAIKNGAWDYIQKPINTEKIKLPLKRVIQFRKNMIQEKKLSVALMRSSIVGDSAPMQRCLDLLAQAAGSDASVLITGETGTGKELFARAVHDNSVYASRAFVVVDCTVLPQDLVESVLFGHKKGAFTGADRDQEGLILQAHGGTLFLDEVGELPLAVQKKFLRVLQERRFRPVGGRQEIGSLFRLVAATNRDLDAMAASGQFRRDLLYRLRALTIPLPPLRERGDDIRQIAIYHMAKFCERNRLGTKGFTAGFIEALGTYSWPGNVRELINTVETALGTVGIGDMLSSMHLPIPIRIQLARASVINEMGTQTAGASQNASLKDISLPTYREKIRLAEKEYLVSLMAETQGDIKIAGDISGLSRSRLYALIKKHQIKRR